MIICPNCKEEIEDDSYFCDQCGQALLYCERCGKVGKGRRCIYCGGLMISPEDRNTRGTLTATSNFDSITSAPIAQPVNIGDGIKEIQLPKMPDGIPHLMLFNNILNINIIAYNGAIIGRRQGLYKQFFEKASYVSGMHAQLTYNAKGGWCIVDKHSSNGTKINGYRIQPDVPMGLHEGDMVSIANVTLQVSIK